MPDHVLFNPGATSLVYTPDGRSIDAGERVVGHPGSPHVKALVEAGLLVDLGPVEDDDEKSAPRGKAAKDAKDEGA